MPLNCGAGEGSWKSLGQQGGQASQSQGKSTRILFGSTDAEAKIPGILVIWCEQPTHWISSWCWERLRAEEEGVRGWDDWLVSPLQWTWTWAEFGKWWGTGRPRMLQSMRLQRVGYNWGTEQQYLHRTSNLQNILVSPNLKQVKCLVGH